MLIGKHMKALIIHSDGLSKRCNQCKIRDHCYLGGADSQFAHDLANQCYKTFEEGYMKGYTKHKIENHIKSK